MTDNGRDGGQLPKQAICIGGKGADGKFYYIGVDNNGNLNVSATAEMAAEATAAAPAYIEGQNAPLSQDLKGNLRIKETGATNLATGQITSTGTAATLAVARATRRSVLFTNTDATGSVWIGPATVTAGNGQKLSPGQACAFTWIGLFQVIDDGSDHCVVCVADEYD